MNSSLYILNDTYTNGYIFDILGFILLSVVILVRSLYYNHHLKDAYIILQDGHPGPRRVNTRDLLLLKLAAQRRFNSSRPLAQRLDIYSHEGFEQLNPVEVRYLHNNSSHLVGFILVGDKLRAATSPQTVAHSSNSLM
jgi:hypothetical protein